MTLEARRKNQGKQYSVVSTEDRTIRYWHRPGDPLPVILNHAGADYLLTKEVVEQARVKQRSPLIRLEVQYNADTGKNDLVVPKDLRKTFKRLALEYSHTTARAREATHAHEVVEEVNWKAVGIVVAALGVVSVVATAIALAVI